jgi:hypothetical protein
MASRPRLAASLLAVVAVVLLGTTAAIAANGNGQANGNGNEQANGNGNGQSNGSSNSNSNGQSNGNSNSNSQSNGNGNGQSNGNGNGQSNGNGNGQSNGNGNGQSNGNGNGNTPVTICHNPSTDASTLFVNDSAVQPHLAHGDHVGACNEQAADEEGESQDQQETTDVEQTTDERQEDDSALEQDPTPTSLVPATGSPASAPGETRTLYCSTNGPVDRGTGERPGVALNLPESQGALLVEKGLVTPAIFYAGLGVSCDVLPGYVYAGFWVDHVGDVVAGVSVYPYYVPAS